MQSPTRPTIAATHRPSRVDSYRDHGDEAEHVTRLLAAHPPVGDHRFACYRIHDRSPFSDLARAVEGTVFHDFFANDPVELARVHARYEHDYSCLLVIDRVAGRVAGTMRFLHGTRSLKSLDDLALPPLALEPDEIQRVHAIEDFARCWDITTVAVKPAYRDQRSHLVSTLLYAAAVHEALLDGATHFIAILDAHAYAQLTRLLCVPFRRILDSGEFPFLGSPASQAGILTLAGVRPVIGALLAEGGAIRDVEPLLRLIVWGEGLPPVTRVG